jgi:AraC-like DNA-binding protein
MPGSSEIALLHLQDLETNARASTWACAVRQYFPGSSVQQVQTPSDSALIRGRTFGAGSLWEIVSPPVHFHYAPTGIRSSRFMISVMLQLEGSTIARQGQRSCNLRAEEITVIDESAEFDLQILGGQSRFMFLKLPRRPLLDRYPWFERCTSIALDRDDAGVTLLSSFLRALVESASHLGEDQCVATLSALTQLLSVPAGMQASGKGGLSRRIRSALALIESRFSDPSLNASSVASAQGVSRRRLDQIFLNTLGLPVSAQIWKRRLAQAASDLQCPAQPFRNVTEIAFSVGFQNVAHFTSAFKKRYHCTPREWRGLTGSDGSPP